MTLARLMSRSRLGSDARILRQTYGVQGTSPVPPDLIKAQELKASGVLIDDHILSTDESEPMPTSPAQALQQQEDRQRDFPNGRAIPLYESDGTTVIGMFTIGL